ncbi:MAG TPA: hypothetical protein VEF90_04595 [Xanthobacteraceae bacterium]|nr:hypothetical protein [Xanthobacteraceae bacterium]
MFQLRRLAVTATALPLIAGAFFVGLFSAADARAEGSSGGCDNAAELAVLPAPIAPWKGAPLRVVVAAEKPLQGEFSLVAPDGSVAAKSRDRHGGPPYFWFAEVAAPAAGTWHATLALDRPSAGCSTVMRDIAVRDEVPPPPGPTPGSLWPLRNSWNRATENLYSAWIQKLFDGPLDTELSWPALHNVLRDRSRNVLFNYLGLGEDQMGTVMRPDCADQPYYLRAYFAFKMGLPFGFSKCSRGDGGKPPKCYGWFNILNAETAKQSGLAASFAHYLPIVGDGVQSGNGRTSANDDNTDFYPVPLTQATLRPGTIYADPYGHVLMLVRRVPQSGGSAGVFLAVDAEPDGSVTRKRFWRGNFLFVHDPTLGGPGFKRFRPIVRESNGALRRLTNAEIAKDPDYGDFSLEQAQLGAEEFYDRMDEVMSPEPLDPLRAMEDAIISLDEQVKTRVTAVENGRKFQNGAHGEATMPDGPSIFETTGAWEDFSTPARDFRLLIAIDVVRGFPDRVARRPERYAIPNGKSVAQVRAELQSVLGSELSARKFSYTRSDGSPWTLTLKDVVDRADALEMAYNPNDCVELRWGAPDNSDEASTCRRHAPAAQRAKMTQYRAWFRERHWPHA